MAQHGLEEIKIAPTEVRLHGSPPMMKARPKRKREDVGERESDDDTLGSDEEFGWAGDDDSLDAENLIQ